MIDREKFIEYASTLTEVNEQNEALYKCLGAEVWETPLGTMFDKYCNLLFEVSGIDEVYRDDFIESIFDFIFNGNIRYHISGDDVWAFEWDNFYDIWERILSLETSV